MSDKDLITFAYISLFLIVGMIIVVAPFIISRLIHPRTRTEPQSFMTYECA